MIIHFRNALNAVIGALRASLSASDSGSETSVIKIAFFSTPPSPSS